MFVCSTGAVRVFIFDHTIRRQPKDERAKGIQLRGPVRRVHIDQSYSASEQRVTHHLPEEANELLKKRFQIINVGEGYNLIIPKMVLLTISRSGVPSRPSTKTPSV